MSDMLSQAEIDALLNGTSDGDVGQDAEISNIINDTSFTPEEADALGEIGNISMGTAATTLFTLLGQKVLITTPQVTITSWSELAKAHTIPYVAVKVEYTEGLEGVNLLILKEEDTQIITDLMMGGDGNAAGTELSELHLSAIGEAMNQMIGSASTSMSSMFNKKIDISPPDAFIINFNSDEPFGEFNYDQEIVQVAFRMVVGDLIDSQIMQLLPMNFAKELVNNLLAVQDEEQIAPKPKAGTLQPEKLQNQQVQQNQAPQYQTAPNISQSIRGGNDMPQQQEVNQTIKSPVNVQPVQFQSFEDSHMTTADKENISLIMDVPLEITVELGRTQRLIRDILEFVPGSIVELDKLAGEPIDILVNGKVIAKGEVVVIDESFGVRITDIVNPSKRL